MEKEKELEKEIKRLIERLEKAVFEGDVGEAYNLTQRLRKYVKVAKELGLWNRGNQWFAMVGVAKKVKESFERKNLRELEESLEKMEKILRR